MADTLSPQERERDFPFLLPWEAVSKLGEWQVKC
jgi:hypothetical protein